MKKNNVLKNLIATWKLVKEYHKKLYLGIFFASLLGIISAISPLLSAKMLLHISDGLMKELLQIAIIVFILEISRNACSYLMNLSFQKYITKTSLAIQIKVAKETLALETKELDCNSSGLFIDRITKDTRDMSSIFVDIGDVLIDIITNIGVLIAILFINPYIFLFFIVTSILIFYLEKKRTAKWCEADKIRRKNWEKSTSLTGELIRGIRDIKDLNCGQIFLNKMNNVLTDANEESYKVEKTNYYYRFIIGNIKDMISLLFIILGIILINYKMITISSFVICYMYRNQIISLLGYFSYILELIKKYDVAASRVFEIINNDHFTKEQFGNKHIKKATGGFEFRNVNFGYTDDKKILNGMSFKINPNETVAIVGKSGEGKTTIFNLLNKLYKVDNNQIFIDGIDINELDCSSIRNNMSVISQSPYIFNMSIKDNLKMVKSNVTEKEVEEACRVACLDEYIESLPNKYDTIVGEGGVTLSGGLKQRLAIARALIQKTEIILFDEATSALDNETQSKIKESIKNMKGEYTIIMIAHRLSTVVDSDRIIFIEDGKKADEGTHKYLLKHNQSYQKLYNKDLV